MSAAVRISGQDPVSWFDRFAQRRRSALAQQDSSRHAREAARRPGTRPSHELSEYAGSYEHPGYGLIVIDAKDGMLHWRYRGLTGPLVHRHYDVFEVPETPDALAPDFLPITFGYDSDGNIDRLAALFEPMVGDIVFRRMPAGEALDPAFRALCAGIYQGGLLCHVVALEPDGELTLSPSDQPTYRLTPYQGRVFAIVGLKGFRVEFQPGETGPMDAIVFYQPDGVSRAQRVTDGWSKSRKSSFFGMSAYQQRSLSVSGMSDPTPCCGFSPDVEDDPPLRPYLDTGHRRSICLLSIRTRVATINRTQFIFCIADV